MSQILKYQDMFSEKNNIKAKLILIGFGVSSAFDKKKARDKKINLLTFNDNLEFCQTMLTDVICRQTTNEFVTARDTPKLSKEKLREVNKTISPESENSDSRTGGKIFLNYETWEYENITDEQIDFWNRTYPAVDILQEIKRSAAWVQANPKKKKTDYKKFINNWLSRQQDRARPKPKENDPFNGKIWEDD